MTLVRAQLRRRRHVHPVAPAAERGPGARRLHAVGARGFDALEEAAVRRYMDRDLGARQEDLESIHSLFIRAMSAASELFGNDAFRKRYSVDSYRSLVNKALFEALSVSLAKLADNEIAILVNRAELLRSEFIDLCNNREFDSSISQGTSNPTKVALRFRKTAELLQKVINANAD